MPSPSSPEASLPPPDSPLSQQAGPRELASAATPDEGRVRDLARHSARGAALGVAAQGLHIAVQVATVAALARVLAPDEFGVVAMVSSVAGFLSLFKDAGLSVAIVREQELSSKQLSTLFWIQLGTGSFLALLLMALTPLLSWYFQETRLGPVVLLMALVFPLECASQAPTALLHRRMAFASRALVPLAGVISSGVVALVLARRGWSYYAIPLGLLAAALLRLLLSWWLAAWRPSLNFALKTVHSHLRTGFGLMSYEVANYFSHNFDNLLIGRRFGAQALGLYTRAYQLFFLPISLFNLPLHAAVLPALSRLRHSPREVSRLYLAFLSLSSLLGLPLLILLMFQAELVISLLLGSGWEGSVGIFRLLALAGLFQVAQETVVVLMIVQGRSRDLFLLGLANSSLSALAFLAGLPFGPQGVAAAYALYRALSFVPMVAFGLKKSVRGADFARAYLKGLGVAGMLGAACFVARQLTHPFGPWAELGTALLLGLPLCAALGALFYRKSSEMQLLKDLLRARTKS